LSDGNLIHAFLEQASAKGSKSTILQPLGWMMAICISATFSAGLFSPVPWVTILFAVFSALTMALYLYAYLYSLYKNPDALRSESYTIQKLAIEKGFVGDDTSGTIPIERLGYTIPIDVNDEESGDEK